VTKRDIDEQVVRDRRDPRREETVPPERKAPSEVPSVTDLAPSVVPIARVQLEKIDADAPPPSSRRDVEPPSSKRAIVPASMPKIAVDGTPGVVTSTDPRLEEVEGFLRINDWDGVLRALGPPEQAGKLPPNLGLLYAIARKEKETDSKGSDATEIAIRCTAGLLGVAVDSPLALVVGKRIVRKNPVAWQKAPAPPASVSAVIILIAIVIGGGIGWLFATGRLHVRW
jgi:hypothetical protein